MTSRFDLLYQSWHVVPGRRRLQRVHRVAMLPQRVTQVRCAETALDPLLAETPPGGNAAVLMAQVHHLGAGFASDRCPAGKTAQQHDLLAADAAHVEHRLQQPD